MVLQKIIFIVLLFIGLSTIYGQRPVAIHYDIEPYNGLPITNTTFGYWLDLMQQLKLVINGATKMNVDIAIGMASAWTYTNSTTNITRPVGEWITDITDCLTIMSYRDHASPPNGIIDLTEAFIPYANTMNKKVVSGVETSCNATPSSISFCSEGEAFMENELDKVKEYFNTTELWEGIAVHDYANYAILNTSGNVDRSFCRATWLWQHSTYLDANESVIFFDFASKHNICTVFVDVENVVDDASLSPILAQFVANATLRNIGIQLLFGNPLVRNYILSLI